MAYTKKTNNVSNNTPKEEIKETVKKTESKKEEKVFTPEDTIPCRSLISGGLYIEGSRSHILYSWADCGDVVDMEYRDLVYLVRTREDVNIYSPRIIIEDDDFVEQNKSVSLRSRMVQWFAAHGQWWAVRLYHLVVMKWLYRMLYGR